MENANLHFGTVRVSIHLNSSNLLPNAGSKTVPLL